MAHQFNLLVNAQIDSASRKRIQQQLNTLTQKPMNVSMNVKGINNVGKLNQNLKQTQTLSKSAGQGILDITGKVLKFGVATKIITSFVNTLRRGVDVVFEFDKSLTELKKVTKLSADELDNYTKKLGELGREVGRTRTEMVDAATQFKRGGFSDEDSATLAKIATEYQNVSDGEISAADSAAFLISQIKAFNINADDSIRIIDSVNEVAANFATSTDDLVLALEKSGASLGNVGNSYEQTIALVTGANEILQGQASKVGLGLRTISINLAKIAAEAQGTDATISGVTFAVKDANGQMLNTYDIMTQLAPKWETLNDQQKTLLAQTIAGKNRYDVFVATMKNMASVTESYETAITSAGSADRQNAVYMESLQAKVNALKAEFEELVLGDGGVAQLVRLILDLGIKILKFANTDLGTLIIKITAVGLAIKAVKTIWAGSKIVTGIKAATAEIIAMQTALGGAQAKSQLVVAWLSKISPLLTPIAALLGAGALAVGFYELYKHVFSTEAKLKNAKKELKDISDEINDINKEYEGLSKKKNLTDLEKERLEYLEKQTKELEKQKALKTKQVAKATEADFSYTEIAWDDKSARGGTSKTIKGLEAVKKALNDTTKAVGNYQSAYDASKQSITDYNEKIKEQVNQFDGLIDSYYDVIKSGETLSNEQQDVIEGAIQQKLKFADLSNTTADLTEAEMYFAIQEQLTTNTSETFNNSLDKSIAKFLGVKGSSKEAKTAIAQYKLQALAATKTGLINALNNDATGFLNVAKAAGIATDAIIAEANAMVAKRANEKSNTVASPAQASQIWKSSIAEQVSARIASMDWGTPIGVGGDESPTGGGDDKPKTKDKTKDYTKGEKEFEKYMKKQLALYQKGEITATKYYSNIQKKAKSFREKDKISQDDYKKYTAQAYKDIFEELEHDYKNGELSAQRYHDKLILFAEKAYKKGKITYDEYRDYLETAEKALYDSLEKKANKYYASQLEKRQKGKISINKYIENITNRAQQLYEKGVYTADDVTNKIIEAYNNVFDELDHDYERGAINAETYYEKVVDTAKRAYNSDLISYEEYRDRINSASDEIKEAKRNAFLGTTASKSSQLLERYQKGEISAGGYISELEGFYGKALGEGLITVEEFSNYMSEAYEDVFSELDYQYEKGKISFEKYYGDLSSSAENAYRNGFISYEKYRSLIDGLNKELQDEEDRIREERLEKEKEEEEKALKEKKELLDDFLKSRLESFQKGEISARDFVDRTTQELKKAAAQGIIDSEEYENYIKQMYNDLFDELGYDYNNGVIVAKEYFDKIKNYATDAYKHGIYSFSEYRDVILDGLQKISDARKKDIEEQKDQNDLEIRAMERYAEYMSDELDKQIESKEKEKESIQETNKEQEKAIKLEQLQQALAEARAKKVRVYKAGVGFVFEEDIDAVSKAQADIISEQTEQVKNAEEERVNAEIEALRQEKNAWSEMLSEYKQYRQDYELEQKLGMSFEAWIQQKRLDNLESFSKAYKEKLTTGVDLGISAEKQEKVDAWNKANIDTALSAKFMSYDEYGGVQWGDSESELANKIIQANARGYFGGSKSISFSQFANVNERGRELFVSPNANAAWLSKGTGIVPHNLTENLMDIGRFNLSGLKSYLGKEQGGQTIVQNFESVVLPNVHDFNSFINEMRDLQNFSNMAISKAFNR